MDKEQNVMPSCKIEAPRCLWDAITQNNALCKQALDFIDLKSNKSKTHKDYIITALCTFVAHSVGGAGVVESLNHSEHISLYAALVGNPAANKSNAVVSVQKPTFERNKELIERSILSIKDYEKNAKLSKESTGTQRPSYRQLIVQDFTEEALLKAVATNQDSGIIGVFDELKGLFNGMGRYSQSSNLIQHLQTIYEGKQPLIVNRRDESKNIYAEKPYLSMIGTIQPLALVGCFKPDSIADGFIGRWLFAYPYDDEEYKDTITLYDSDFDSWYNELIKSYLDRNHAFRNNPFVLLPDAEKALKSFEQYKEQYSTQLKNYGGDLDLFSMAASSYVTKCGYFVPRLAVVVHLLGNNPQSLYISAGEMKTAIEMTLYYQNVFLNRIIPLFTIDKTPKKPLSRREIVQAIYQVYPDAKLEDVAKAIGSDKGNVSRYKNDK